jgi:tetratricopeptide (TPR) repeat protein
LQKGQAKIDRSVETRNRKELDVKRIYFLLWSCILLSACAAYRGASDVVQGREALLAGNNQAALIYFQQAEQADPDYMYGAELREGVGSFLGRSQYLAGDYAQARQTLEKALARHKSDNLARLYLGLTLYRLGDQKAALTNIERGMKGVDNWLNYLNTNFAQEFGQGWDPGGTIRAGIRTDLNMISSSQIDWPKLIADGERLGLAIVQAEQNFRIPSLRG